MSKQSHIPKGKSKSKITILTESAWGYHLACFLSHTCLFRFTGPLPWKKVPSLFLKSKTWKILHSTLHRRHLPMVIRKPLSAKKKKKKKPTSVLSSPNCLLAHPS